MKKAYIKYYIILGLSLLALVSYENFRDKPIDWKFTLSKDDKIPYGTYVLYNTLEDIFKAQEIINNRQTLYQYKFFNEEEGQNFIFIANHFKLDDLDTDILLEFANKGSSIFIAANSFEKTFRDTLNIATSTEFAFVSKGAVLEFANPKLKTEKKYSFKKAIGGRFFSKVDTANAVILGLRDKTAVNFIKVPFGKGAFFLNTEPAAFTNYNMLDSANAEYAYKAISYLPVKTTVWDNYSKKQAAEKSHLRYIFKNPALKAGYSLLAISLLFYIFFSAKRKQRVIPVMKPFKNTSLKFTETVARVYLHNKNHKDIALKKYSYLLDFLRRKYYIQINDQTQVDYASIAEKSGATEDTVKSVFALAKTIENSDTLSEALLLKFNNWVEQFYKECL